MSEQNGEPEVSFKADTGEIYSLAELRERITSPGLRSKGDSMSAAWKSVLRDPHQYMTITPEELLRPACGCPDTRSIALYLKKRYWT